VHISLIDIVISIALKSVKFHWFRFRKYIFHSFVFSKFCNFRSDKVQGFEAGVWRTGARVCQSESKEHQRRGSRQEDRSSSRYAESGVPRDSHTPLPGVQ